MTLSTPQYKSYLFIQNDVKLISVKNLVQSREISKGVNSISYLIDKDFANNQLYLDGKLYSEAKPKLDKST